jgi:hypothetical protein
MVTLLGTTPKSYLKTDDIKENTCVVGGRLLDAK